jgi:hypothetical protein
MISSLHHSLVTSIEEQALQSEGNGPVPWNGLQIEFLERTPGKNSSAELSPKDGVEAVGSYAFSLPGSPLDRESVVVFPRTMNSLG